MTYENNRDVSTADKPAKVIVDDKSGGNYAITRTEVSFQITSRAQATLSITNRPSTFIYGDEFTLETSGGSGNGDVTWEIISGQAQIGQSSGHVTITGHGDITVKATKSGKDPATGVVNYEDAIDTWTFTAVQKPVTATVTAGDKDYDGNNGATVHAVVEQGVLPGDEVTITGLTGAFSDENAGVDKTVTVVTTGAAITGNNSEHYAVSYSNTTVKAAIHKAVVNVTTPPAPASLTYNGTAQALIATGAVVDTTGVGVEYALSKDGSYSTDFPKGTNAGVYTVWYHVKETSNYTGLAPVSVDVTIAKKSVSPTITLDGNTFTYDGNPKEPVVTLYEADGTTLIPAGEYTVAYSGNTNVGTATVTVTAKDSGNYTFENAPVTATFTINKEQAQVLTAPEAAGLPLTFNTFPQRLVTAGVASGGTMVYSVNNENGTYSTDIPTRADADKYTVYYKVQGDSNHSDSAVGHVDVTIAPKRVDNPTIQLFNADDTPLVNYTYDGNAKKPKAVVKDGSTVIAESEYEIRYDNNIDAGNTAVVNIIGKSGGNYDVTGSKTFVIQKADIVFNPAPSAANITYDGKPHELLLPGTTTGGTVQYALGSPTTTFDSAIPQATLAGTYTIYYKVVGDKNHNDLNDLANQKVDVAIQRKPLTAITIELTPNSFEYDGNVKLPTVAVKFKEGKTETVVPETEYDWACRETDPTNVGTYHIDITDAANGNYDLSVAATKTATFTIEKIDQAKLVIEGKPEHVYYGDTFKLTTSGGSGNGAVTWTAVGGNATINADGTVTITNVGEVTINVVKAADTNYEQTSAQWTFTAAPKPVTASVTVSNKPYDGTTAATVASAGITTINGDTVTIDPASITAAFDTPNAGTGKTVMLDASKVQVTGDTAKYAISYPETVTANITQATTTIDTAPAAIASLTYNGQPQALVTAGQTNVGFLVYSLDGTSFSREIPTGTNAGTYTVYYRVDGTADYTGVAVNGTPISVTIDPKNITSTVKVELSESSFLYDGTKKEPKITVKDGSTVIDTDQYVATWDKDLTAAGTHTVTISEVSGKNYTFTAVTASVEIKAAPQDALHITGKPDHVYYGDTITLKATGGSGNGTLEWSITPDTTVATIDQNTGVLTVKSVGPVTVTVKRTVPNYVTATDTWSFTAKPKPVMAIVKADDKVYDGKMDATIHITWEPALVGTDTINTTGLSGAFADADAGADKTVNITGGPISSDKYAITIPSTVTASIFKADTAAPNLTANALVYDGTPQDLVTGGNTGKTFYSNAKDGVYSTTVPTGTNAGTYTVWYQEKGDANHNDSELRSIQVTITRKALTLTDVNVTVELSGNDLQGNATDGYYYEYDGTERKPSVIIKDGTTPIPASEYTVSYSDNKNVSTADKKATVTITDSGDGNYNVSGSVTFEIRKGSAQMATYPQARILTYTGQQQELITGGTATGGHVEYSLDGGAYSADIPKADLAKTYTVTYKVVGDSNHEDNPTVGSVTVTIQPKEVISPKITVTGTYTYDGNEQKPTGTAVTVEDGATPIPDTEYTLSYQNNVNAGTATVIVTNANGGNYIVNGTATFEIGTALAGVGTAPTGKTGLKYNGTAQELLETKGTATGGTLIYSLDQNGEYSPAIPTGKAVGEYEVWYMVQGDANHSDTTPVVLSPKVEIAKNTVTNPTIQVEPASVKYTGEKQEPTVTVKDDSGLLIDGSEYTVVYLDGNNNDDLTAVGTYTVTITGKADGNYTFNTTKTATFTITPADQTPLTITGTWDRVCYGDTIQLGTTGGIDGGTVTWKVNDGSPASIDTNGLLKVTGVGSVTVTATSTKTGYADQTATWNLYADKKPVTALVTAASKTYDGNATAAVTATLQGSDFMGTDSFTITLTGCTFEDPNAGTDKKVNVVSTNLSFTVNAGGANCYENYAITYPAAATASIFKADITAADVTVPTAATGLTYTGLPQELVTEGSSTEGTLEYSVDGKTYSASLPTGTDAGDYDVWYRVKGDGNHNDTAGTKLGSQVTIAKQTVDAPTIELNPTGASYDGQEHRPEVTVLDANGRVIPASEYTVGYGSTNWKDVGDHTVTVTGKADGNYDITGTHTETFTILPAGQSPLSIVGQPGRVQYGDVFTLSTNGGSGTGAVTWETSDSTVAYVNSQTGRVEIKKAGGPVTITARKAAGGGYGETTATWTFSAEKRPAAAIVTAKDRAYDANRTDAELVITWKDGDLLGNDTITLNLTGAFDDANVGTDKIVRITRSGDLPDGGGKYAVTYNNTTTASITAQAATVSGVQSGPWTYSGSEISLLQGGAATNGTIVYSRNGVDFMETSPTEANAGRYTVYYKARGNTNYADSEVRMVEVTIQPKAVAGPTIELSPESFEYDGTEKEPDVVSVKDGNNVIPASEYTVSYSNNISVGTARVNITDVPGGNYTVSGSKTFTIKAGAASLKDAPKANNLTYNGFEQELVTEGTAVNGQVVYAESKTGSYSTSIPMKADAGTYQVWYKVQGTNGAADTTPKQLVVTIRQKEVTPVIRIGGRSSYSVAYNGSAQEPDITVYVESKEYSDLYYTVEYDGNDGVGTAEVTVTSTGGNYQFLAFKTFTITKGKAAFASGGEPVAKTSLVYTGEPQDLVEDGIAEDVNSIVVYSLDRTNYSPLIPTGINRGSYTVYAKVQGNEFYEDSAVVVRRVTIGVNALTADQLIVSLSASSFPYTGSEQKPTVTVTDKISGNVISADEYTATYSNNVNVGTAKVSIKSKTTGNYSFTAEKTFTILAAGQTPLAITGKKDTVYYGDTLSLGTTGGDGSGSVTWSSSDMNVADIDASSGVIQKIKTSGSVTITATKAASGSYGESKDTWTFYAQPKPVTATVTAANKPYDGNNTATLTVTIGGLVSGDIVNTVTAQGHFADASVGEDKTVVITGLTIPDAVSKMYDIGYNSMTTASITPKAATVTAAPTAVTGPLTYNGSAQALLENGGTADGGNLMYSLDGQDYSYNLPTATDAGSYTIWYKVVASDENHKDSAAVKLGDVTIAPNVDAPTVLCTPGTVQYNGREQTPTVVVRDSAQRIIPESEYTVTLPTPRIAVGKYKVTVTDKPDGNYKFDTPVEGTFEIVSASQNPLSIITSIPNDVHYGDTFRLSAQGGSGSGAVQWSIAESNVATIDGSGNVKVTGTGGFTVKAFRKGADGYSDSNTDSVPFEAKPKPVTPVVTAADKPYDGKTDATLTASWKSGDLVGTDTIALTVNGAFATADTGNNKRVSVIGNATGTDTTLAKYAITWPDITTASIYKVDAKLETAPAGTDLTYTGSAQALVTAGTTVGNIGTVVYSTSQNGAYSETIPTGTNADKYTVWYKVADSVNYTGIAPAAIEVEIKKAEPSIRTNPTASGTEGQSLSQVRLEGGATDVSGAFAWKDGSIKPAVGTSKQTVVFTPDDTANYTTKEFQIDVTIQSASGTDSTNSGSTGTSGTSSTDTASIPLRTTVRNGAASTVVSNSAGRKLVSEAAANQSKNIVIQPELSNNVTKSEVSIPSSTVSQINSQTDAALTVASPIADVTIPNGALDTLGSAGGTVSVVTEQVDQAVVLTLTAGGETVESVPGGVTLSLPAEDAGPGTVAVLVGEDGTRETLRKSVVEDGKLNVSLSGSATVEIVDNSKEFEDVSSDSWAADAVAFASAHELFSGTSETTFSPDQPMSRGMLTTVLYNLEGRPEQDLTMGDLTDGYGDVNSGAWYADGIAWASEQGIVSGYGNGQFGPDDSVTREQFVVMLWRYAGGPKANNQTLSFSDADQASSFAQEALCWAVEQGILNGYANGQLVPGGTATRAEAAQMLKNFMENT